MQGYGTALLPGGSTRLPSGRALCFHTPCASRHPKGCRWTWCCKSHLSVCALATHGSPSPALEREPLDLSTIPSDDQKGPLWDLDAFQHRC